MVRYSKNNPVKIAMQALYKISFLKDPSGMIFYITPTLQFLLGYFYYNEPFSLIKLASFIFIWIAVIIYLKDLYETNQLYTYIFTNWF